MAPRLELQHLLVSILGSDEVYFQPPPTIKMEYPCIVYQWNHVATKYANNLPYNHAKRYQLTIIDRDPESVIPDKIAQLPTCAFDRFFTAENLNHYVYNLFF